MNKPYLAIVCVLFITFTVVFCTFHRPEYSELEKRELAVFPAFSLDKLAEGTFTSEVSSWFSDSEPFRDVFMHLSMGFKDFIHLSGGHDNISFHASANTQSEDEEDEEDIDRQMALLEAGADSLNGHQGFAPADENAKIANNGILIIGEGDNVRALMAYGGSGRGCVGYARAANKYKDTFPDVNIYCMVIPTSVEYYCPEKARKRSNPQRPTIDNVIEHLSPGVKMVDIYYTLRDHAAEDIFLRTDHHWAPLGAFYAAKHFAEVAGVPFRDLDAYEQRVVHGYVGSMYGYSQDIAIKDSPEDFVYHVPKDVTYETTYINYAIDENYNVIGEGKPFKSVFFFRYKDGSGGAYCTFMGGDTKLTRVVTGTKNGRRLIILKDSFGNALPGYLFYSFEEIHVIDSRYFTKNMVEYVRENNITDILFANNIFKAYSSYTYKNYVRFLTQRPGVHRKPAASAADSIGSSGNVLPDTVVTHSFSATSVPAVTADTVGSASRQGNPPVTPAPADSLNN